VGLGTGIGQQQFIYQQHVVYPLEKSGSAGNRLTL